MYIYIIIIIFSNNKICILIIINFFLVDVQVDPHLKSLHLTLAYQFDISQKETLKTLIKSTINSSTPCLWELNLYSRETTAAHKQVTFY